MEAKRALEDIKRARGELQKFVEAARKGMAVDDGCPAHGYCVLGRAFEKLGGLANYKRAEREFQKAVNCGSGPFHDHAVQQVERQQALARAEEAKQGGAGTP